MKYKLVDLFCGCGGISRGFEWGGRFGTQFGVELSPHPAAAFLQNVRNVAGNRPHMLVGDITNLTNSPTLLWSELRKSGINSPGEIDVLAGGPPCQGFSRNGVRKYKDSERSQRFYDDPRNHLYKSFLQCVEHTRPKIVLIENVREFLNFGGGKFSRDLVTKLQELGYEVAHKKICAADYGVPQVRWRVLFFAVRKDVTDATGFGPYFPTATFGRDETQLSLLSEKQAFRTVRDAITDLPTPDDQKRSSGVSYDRRRTRFSELAKQLRNPNGIVFNHFIRKLSPKQVARINAVGSGRMKDIAPELRTKKYYGSAYRRLNWDEPALTITTWVYHVGSGQFAHPEEDRGITMREAARIQTFDDAYIFPPLINPVSQMIGNAVPPLLAHQFSKIAEQILDDHAARAKIPRMGNVA